MFGLDRRGGAETWSLYDLVGVIEDRPRNSKTERLGGFDVDHQLEPFGLLDRQIDRLCALENFSGIQSSLAPNRSSARAIANQSASIGKLAPSVDRRYGIAGRERYELLAPSIEERIGADEKSVDVQVVYVGEIRFEIAFDPSFENFQLDPHSTCCILQFLYFGLASLVVWIY